MKYLYLPLTLLLLPACSSTGLKSDLDKLLHGIIVLKETVNSSEVPLPTKILIAAQIAKLDFKDPDVPRELARLIHGLQNEELSKMVDDFVLQYEAYLAILGLVRG